MIISIAVTIIKVFLSVILIWLSSVIMVTSRNILYFLPFLIFGIIYSFEGALTFYEVNNKELEWIFSEIFSIALLLWLFLNLFRKDE